jgi:hypothetical protein
VAVRASTLLALVRRYLVSFSFFTTWHTVYDLVARLIELMNIYLTLTPAFTPSTKTFAGLNAGILWAGILIVVFLEIFLPVFSALVLMMKLPNPRKYTFSPDSKDCFTSPIKASTVA